MNSDPTGHLKKWATIALGVAAAVAAVAVTALTFGAAAPAAICSLTTMAMYVGASYAVAKTVAVAAVVTTSVAATAYAGDRAYSSVTGQSPLKNTVFRGNESAYNAGLAITSFATVGMFSAATYSPTATDSRWNFKWSKRLVICKQTRLELKYDYKSN